MKPIDPAPLVLLALSAGVVFALVGWRWRFVPRGLLIVMLVAALVPASVLGLKGWSFPVFSLPAPSGPFRVGREDVQVTHDLEMDLVCWFPSDSDGRGESLRYFPHGNPMRRWLFSNLDHVVPHARKLPFPTRGQFPVLLMLPGAGGEVFENTVVIEDLASHGFVVVGVEMRGGSSPPQLDYSSLEAVERLQQAGGRFVAERTQRLRNLIENLPTMAPDLAKVADFDRLGVLGFSVGGAVAVQSLVLMPEVKAAANLDGLIFGEAVNRVAEKPALLASDGTPRPNLDDRSPKARLLEENGFAPVDRWEAGGQAWVFSVPGFNHSNYTDRPLWSRRRSSTGSGEVPRRESVEMVREVVTSFFCSSLGDMPEQGPDLARFELLHPVFSQPRNAVSD